MSVLVLDEHDVRELLTMAECIEAMDEVLRSLARGKLHQPLRFVTRPPEAGTLMGLMPAYRDGEKSAWALKAIVIAPANPGRGLDAHQGAVLLHDGETGELHALLNASPITEIRTAAVSAVATRALARGDARTVAIIGGGVQARSHAAAMRSVLPAAEIRTAAVSAVATRALAREGARTVAIIGGGVQARSHAVAMRSVLPDAEIKTWTRSDGGTPEKIVRGADVVCTCTSARAPVLRREWLSPGAHVNAVGSSVPSARELDAETLTASTLVVDRRESAVNEAGDLILAGLGDEAIAAELGEVLTGARPGRTTADELTVFKSLGLAVEDLAAAELVVRKARERGAGTEVDF